MREEEDGDLWAVPEEVGIHIGALYDTEDFAFNDVEHFLPYGSFDVPQTESAVIVIWLKG
jgi:hypothetical protein